MGRLLSLVLVLPIAIFAAGSGTKADPYTISSVEELVAFRDAVNAGDKSFNGADMSHGGAGLYFKLTKSLDLSSVCGSDVGTWEPIGIDAHPFLGHFDGGSNVIDYLYIDHVLADQEKTPNSGYGLFGSVTSSGEDTLTISNVIIGENSFVYFFARTSLGAVLGFGTGNIVLENCENRGTVHGRENVGGIVGFVDDGYTVIIRDCLNKGMIEGTYGFTGGIAGELSASNILISNCLNSYYVEGRSFAAGIVGKADASDTKAKIEFCKNTGSVSSGDRAAGIAFFLKNVSLESVYNSGSVTASDLAAGIVDSSAGNVLHYMCVNAGKIESTTLSAGIAAYARADRAIFSKCLNVGMVYKAYYTGGIVAFANAGTGSELKITNSINAGEIFDPFADLPDEVGEVDPNSNADGIIGECRSEICNVKNNLDLLTLDAEGGFKSEDLLGKIPDGFDDTLWLAKAGLYPQVKSLASHDMDEIRNISLLAATPKGASVDTGAPGSKSNPLTIASLEDFLLFRDAVNDSSNYKGVKLADAAKGLWFSLEADIDLKTVCGKGIGNWKLIAPFAGNFEGNGHTISNLYMDELQNGSAGLFGPLFADKSTMYIQNFNLDSAYFHVEASSVCLGAVTSQAVHGKVVIRNVKINDLDISVVGSESDSKGSVFIGGIMCNTVADRVLLESDTVTGKMSFENLGVNAGGLIGAAPSPVTMRNNATYVDIEAKGADATIGGLVGQMVAEFDAEGNTNYGNLKATSTESYSFVGGIFGVDPSASTGDVLKNCENKGAIEVSGVGLAVGGIAGFLSGNKNVDISNVVNSGKITVTGSDADDVPNVGGIAGIYNVLTADSLRNTADITVKNAKGSQVGGIAGNIRDLADSVALWNCVNTGNITVEGESVDAEVFVGFKGAALDVSVKIGERDFVPVEKVDDFADDDDSGDDDSGDADDDDSDKDDPKGPIVLPEYSFVAQPFAYRIHRISSGWSVEFMRDESVSSVSVFNMLGKRVNANIVRNGRGFDIVNVPVNGVYVISFKTQYGVKNIKVK